MIVAAGGALLVMRPLAHAADSALPPPLNAPALTPAIGPTSSVLPPPLNATTLKPPKAPAAPTPSLEKPLDCPAKFITALAQDLDGNIWIGTEDQGVFMYMPNGGAIQGGSGVPPASNPLVVPPSGGVRSVPPIGAPFSSKAGPASTTPPKGGTTNTPPKGGTTSDVTTNTHPWRQFTIADGLGDNNGYAIACDKLGRIWVGHLNHGVSVYNGKTWQNYNVIAGLPRDGQPDSDPHSSLPGPLGARIFAIATCPTDGDIWISTEAGLSRYSLTKDTWSYYTRAEGLPSDQASCLAFNKQGDIFVGTQCDGIAIARASEDYKNWKVIHGPEKLPVTATGPGLPTDLINAILVLEPASLLPTSNSQLPSSSPATIFAATDAGLAYSADNGWTWSYIRGQDYADKVRGLYGGPPKGWKPDSKSNSNSKSGAGAPTVDLLTEDYTTNLAQDSQSRIWLCHRQTGYEILDPKNHHRIFSSTQDPKLSKLDGYVSSIIPTSNFKLPTSSTLIARYGSGISQFNSPIMQPPVTLPHAVTPLPPHPVMDSSLPPGTYIDAQGSLRRVITPTTQAFTTGPADPQASNHVSRHFPLLPLTAKPPTTGELAAMLKMLQTRANSPTEPNANVIALPDDWVTQGDWLGRYGRYWACLCAMSSPHDYVWGAGAEPVLYHARIGPHCTPDDGLRYWVHWVYTSNPRSLEMPPGYFDSQVKQGLATTQLYRRQTEMDDHSEAYSSTFEGPDIYFSIRIPKGQFILSFYDFNKDGHVAPARVRDYRISIRKHTADRLYDVADFPHQPELAHGRIHDFWGGVYKRFLVQGPMVVTIKVERNYSHCTILAGVFLDLVDEKPVPYFPTIPTSNTGVPPVDEIGPAKTTIAITRAINAQILEQLDKLRLSQAARWAAEHRSYYAKLQRWAGSINESPAGAHHFYMAKTLSACFYYLTYFAKWEHYQQEQGMVTARGTEHAIQWDGTSGSMSGRERTVIKEYLLPGRSGAADSNHSLSSGDYP